MANIDDRIVRMRFEDGGFQSGISKASSALDNFKARLASGFSNAGSGFERLKASVSAIDFSSVMGSIEKLEHRFSVMGVAGATIVSNITNSIINSAKSIEQATIGQIKSGGWSRAMNIANAKFQIEGLGFAWEKIEDAVNYGVKDTAYGLDAAASAASQLAASGVDFQNSFDDKGLTQMHRSLRAISGVAAMTNSSYEDISHIFTTIAGNGRLMGEQLLQLSGRGMNVAAKLGEVLGYSETEIRDMVSKGKIDFETFANAMDSAFGDHAKEANKTFTGALSNMRAALSRIGAIFATPIIDKTNEVFIALTGRIDIFKKRLSDITNEDGQTVLRFAGHFAEAWTAGVEALSKLINNTDLSWFDKIADAADSAAQKARDFFNLVTSEFFKDEATEENAKDISDNEKKAAKSVEETRKEIDKELYSVTALKKTYESMPQAAKDAMVKAGVYDYANPFQSITDNDIPQAAKDAMIKAGAYEYEKTNEKEQGIIAFLKSMLTGLKNIGLAAKNVFNAVKAFLNPMVTAFKNVFSITDGSEAFRKFTASLIRLSKGMSISIKSASIFYKVFYAVFTVIKNVLDSVGQLSIKIADFIAKINKLGVFKDLFLSFLNIITAIKRAVRPVIEAFKTVFNFTGLAKAFPNIVKLLSGKILEFTASLRISDDTAQKVYEKAVKFFIFIRKAIAILITSVQKAKEFITKIVDSGIIGKLFNKAKDLVGTIIDTIKGIFGGETEKQGKGVFETLKEFISGAFKALFEGFDAIDFSKAKRILATLVIVRTFMMLFLSIRRLGRLLYDIARIPAALTSLFYNIGGTFRAIRLSIAWNTVPIMLKTVAEAIGILAGVVVLLGMMPVNVIHNGIAMVGSLVLLLAAITFLFNKLAKITIASFFGPGQAGALRKFAGALTVLAIFAILIGAAFSEIAFGMSLMGVIDPEHMASAVNAMLAIFVALSLVIAAAVVAANDAAMSITKLGALGVFLFWLSLSIRTIMSSLISVADVENVLDTIPLLIATFVGLAMFMALAAAFSVPGTGAVRFAPMSALGTFLAALSTAIFIIAGAMWVIGKVDKINDTISAIISISASLLVFMIAAATLSTINEGSAPLSIANLLSLAGFVNGIATAVLIMSAAMVVLSYAGDFGDVVQHLISIIVVIGIFMREAAKISALNSGNAPLSVTNLLALAGFINGIATAVLIMSAAMMILNSSGGDFVNTVGYLIAIMVGLGAFMMLASSLATLESGNAPLSITNLLALAGFINSVAVAMVIMSAAMAILAKAGKFEDVIGHLAAMFIGMIAITVIASAVSTNGVPITSLLAIAAFINSIGVAMVIMSVALAILGKSGVTDDVLGNVIVLLGSIFAFVIMAGAFSTNAAPKIGVILSLAVFILALGAALSAMMLALSWFAITSAGSEKKAEEVEENTSDTTTSLSSVMTLLGLTVGLAAAMFTFAKMFKTIQTHCKMIIAGIVALSVAFLIIAASFKIIEDIQPNMYGMVAVIGTMIGIGVMLGVLFAIMSKSLGNAGLVERIGEAFLLIGVSILAIAAALKIVSGITEISDAMGVLIGILIVIALIVVAAGAIGGNYEGLVKLGETMLFIGLGIALIGGAMWLFAKGVELLGPALEMLNEPLDKFFVTLEAHQGAAAVAIILVALVLAAIIALAVKLGPAIGAIAGAISSGIKSIFKLLETGAKKFDGYFSSLTLRGQVVITSLIAALCAGIINASPELLDTIGNMIVKVLVYLGKIVGTVAKALVEIIISLLYSVAEAIRMNSARIIDALWQIVITIAGLFMDIIYTVIGKVGGIIDAIFGTNISQWATDMETMVGEALEEAAQNSKKSAEEIDNAKKAAAGYIDVLATSTEDASNRTGVASNSILANFLSLKNGAAETSESVQDSFADIPQAAKDVMVKAGVYSYAPKNEKDDFKSQIAAMMGLDGDPSEMFNSLGLGSMEDMDTAAMMEDWKKEFDLSSYTSGQFDGATNASADFAQYFPENMDMAGYDGSTAFLESYTMPDEYNLATDENMAGVEESIDEYKERAQKKGEEVGAMIATGIENSRPRLNGAAQYLLGGITEAVKHYTNVDGPEVMDGLCQSLYDAFCEFNRIESPSKLYRDASRFMVKGIANGIDAETSTAETAMDSLGECMIVSFGAPLERIAAMVNGDIPIDPTIRPIMDMSNVGSTADSIDSMFSNQNVTLSGFSGRIAADIGALDQTNTAIIAEIRNMRDDLNYMTEQINGMQVVMDSGALVGQIATPIDRNLGRRAIFKGRGN